MSLARVVGPKDVFKHFVLGQLLRAMPYRFEISFNYFDFAPGPGQYAVQPSQTLQQVFDYARKLFAERKINPFFPYIEDIASFNAGQALAHTQKTPPPVDYMPVYYPSNAGFASLHLGKRDRAIFVEPKPENHKVLSQLFEDEKRVNVLSTNNLDQTVQLSKVLFPPIHHRGLVTWDLDALIEGVSTPDTEGKDQYSKPHLVVLEEAASILHSILKRWPTCTMYIPYPMSSHIPPVSVVRTILNSGATQVLNCNVFWDKKGETPGVAVGALIVNPPLTMEKSLDEQLKTFQQMFVPEKMFNPEKQVSRVYYVNAPKGDGLERPTMTGKRANLEKIPDTLEDFEEWINYNPEREEKEVLASMGKPDGPTSFPQTLEGDEAKRGWQRYITEQIAQGQKPHGHNVIRVQKKSPLPPQAPPAPTPTPRFRKNLDKK